MEDYNTTVKEQFALVKERSEKAKLLMDKILKHERVDPDPKKLELIPDWVSLKQELLALHQAPVGNILSKKLILKGSRTKHRVFNQFRIAKKYRKARSG